MKLLILGSTGKVGRLVVEQALAQGHEVVAFLRTPSKLKLTNPHLTVFQGDARDPDKVHEAMAGVDAVISALGHNSAVKSDVQTAATRAVLAALTEHQRFISLTGFGIPDANDPKPKLSGRLLSQIIKSVPGEMYADSQRHAELLRTSPKQWVMVRAPRMSGKKVKKHTYRTGYLPVTMASVIPRSDVADFMLANLTTDVWLRQAPIIAT
jgi:uncharacterized protein YbjT (DUF2867 family)